MPRSVYWISFTRGGREAAKDGGLEVEFWVDVKDTTSVTMSARGNIQHGSSHIQKELRDCLRNFPDWTSPTAWTVDSKIYYYHI